MRQLLPWEGINMVSEQFKLQGKTALVAGSGRFWVKYAATALAEAGADVAVAGQNSRKLGEAAGEVQRLGRKAMAIPTDLTKSFEVQKMVKQAISELGKIDILVNASDLVLAKPFLETTEDEWRRVMEVNVTSAFLCCQAVGRHMMEQKKGRIINITSCLAERGLSNGAAYCVASGGVAQLTRALALEWAREGITVNAIGAGWISEVEKTGAAQEDYLLRYLPLKRYGHPSEIGSLVVYLASETTDWLTGQFMYVDGALMAHP
jgi:NAD(P)-dependent dehydrogenase (short-subunit alcohol dehydrogenase family)